MSLPGCSPEGHRVTGTARSVAALAQAFPEADWLAMDLGKAVRTADWAGPLDGIEVVVNCAGVLRGPDMDPVHVAMPRALHAAAKAAGVRRIVLLSAISARAEVRTDYARSKLAGEAALERFGRESGLEWTILRPSLVYAEGSYGGTLTDARAGGAALGRAGASGGGARLFPDPRRRSGRSDRARLRRSGHGRAGARTLRSARL
jgi:uncharacterized protein YbjT (DUF2867 family)